MKLPNLERFWLVPILLAICVIGIGFMFAGADEISFNSMLENPVRDMTIGQLIGLIVFVWALFN